MNSTTTTPVGTIEPSSHESLVVELSPPVCPECDSIELVKNGTYRLEPARARRARAGAMVIQCQGCLGSFSPGHLFIVDGHRYPREISRLVRVVNAFTDASLEQLQNTCTVHYGVRPSDQQIDNWVSETAQTGEIVVNDLPVYSTIYIYDEQYLRIDVRRVYRLTVYDDLMRAPVANSSPTAVPSRSSVIFSDQCLRTNRRM